MLLELKCRSCGAALHNVQGKNSFICPYCGSAYIQEQSFYNKDCSQQTEFEVQAGLLVRYVGSSLSPVIPDSVIVIGERAFAGTMIQSITIPESVREIRAYAFLDCKELGEISFPNSLESIGTRAFFRCFSLKKIKWPVKGLPKMRYDDGFPFLGTPAMDKT